MTQIIPQEVCDFLESGLGEKMENFEIKLHKGNEQGQGNLSEMFFISLKNKKTREDHHLLVKQVLDSGTADTMDIMSSSYNNEIHFYTKIIPSLIDFQKSYENAESFKNIPKCLAVSSEKGKEKILLENLMFKKYEMHPKTVPLDAKMYEAIFKMYGKYHGLSYAFKNHQPEKFLELEGALQNNFIKFLDQGLISNTIKGALPQIQEFLEEEGDVEIAEKFKKYVDNGVQLFAKSLKYKSPYGVFLHGDCWSSNMMFKYNESRELEDIKMLDFQMAIVGSPIVDLTYTFYSGAAKETLDNLEHFLNIYYNSLSDTLRQYNCNVEESLPYEALKKEWKEYNTFGFIMGLLVWMTKYAEPTKIPNFNEVMDGTVDSGVMMNMIQKDNENFKNSCLDLLRHMHENDFL